MGAHAVEGFGSRVLGFWVSGCLGARGLGLGFWGLAQG